MRTHSSTLFVTISKESGYREAVAVERLFKQLGLPMPRQGGYVGNTHEGYLVFLNNYGCSIKIQQRRHFEMADTPLALRPLIRLVTPKHIFEIFPGVQSPIETRDLEWLQDAMPSTHYIFDDATEHNCGYLPHITEQFPNGLPVVIDHMALFPDSEPNGVQYEVEYFREVQQNLYGPLRKALREAWPDIAQDADKTKMKAFWDMCRQHTHRPGRDPAPSHGSLPLLCSSWMAPQQIENEPEVMAKLETLRESAAHYQGLINRLEQTNLRARNRRSSPPGLS